MAEPIRCLYCRSRHMPRLLCDPAKALLDAMAARAAGGNLPAIELDQPIVDPNLGHGAGDALVRNIVVKGAVVELKDRSAHHPAIVITGNGINAPLPQWLYAGTDDELRALARLVTEMVEAAIRNADKLNRNR